MSGGLGAPLLSLCSEEAEDSDKLGPMHLTTIGDHKSGEIAYLRESECSAVGILALKLYLTPVKTLFEVAVEESICPDIESVVCKKVEVEWPVVV